MIFVHRTRGEYTVLTHIGVWVKTKFNTPYSRCKFNISYEIVPVSLLVKVSFCFDHKGNSLDFKVERLSHNSFEQVSLGDVGETGIIYVL